MDPQIANKLGTSLLLVPSVHELAKQPMTIVPERYIHPNQDPPSVEFATSHQVPVIDLNKLLSEDENELEKFDLACKEWGFFQVCLIYSPPLFVFSKLKRNIYIYIYNKILN